MISRLIFTGVFLFFSTLAGADPLSEDWELVRQTGDVWIWRHHGNSDVLGTLQSQKQARAIDWSKRSKIASEEFFRDLTQKKIKLLRLIGISGWRARTYTWSWTNPSSPVLTVEGSYSNSRGEKVQFTEAHIFKKPITYQILVTSPEREKTGRAIADGFIKSVKEMVIDHGR